MIKNCKHCNTEISTNNPRTKYCSPKCRLNHWQQLHPEQWKQHQQKQRDKKIKICNGCGVQLSRRRGNRYCESCAKTNLTRANTRSRAKRRDLFHMVKSTFGCCICGWNNHPAALDFHHIVGEKQCEINATNWTTDQALGEYSKCVLVCKNCHYGLHHKFVSPTAIPQDIPDYKQKVLETINTGAENANRS